LVGWNDPVGSLVAAELEIRPYSVERVRG